MHKITYIQLENIPLSCKILHWRRGQHGRLISAVLRTNTSNDDDISLQAPNIFTLILFDSQIHFLSDILDLKYHIYAVLNILLLRNTLYQMFWISPSDIWYNSKIFSQSMATAHLNNSSSSSSFPHKRSQSSGQDSNRIHWQ